MIERIEHVTCESDENGFHLTVTTDEERHEFLVSSPETARSVLAAVNRLRPWIDDYERERRAYNAASDAERAAVLGLGGDGGSSDRDELLREAADIERKRAKEDR